MSETSYLDRGRAAPLNSQVYTKYIKLLGLSDTHRADLVKRGLSHEQILTSGYATKLHGNSKVAMNALAQVNSAFQLKEVPGFYIDEKTGHRATAYQMGVLIPVRDVQGNISSIVIRNAKPTMRNGKPVNKYLAFSSAGKPEGGKVWQQSHCPIVLGDAKEKSGSTIRITEGVLKADVATALCPELYCIGLQGLKVHNDLETILDELEVSTVYICLDAGEDDNKDMLKCKAELISRCRKFGVDVEVEDWQPELGKGIDDVYANGNEKAIRKLNKEEIELILDKANEKDPLNGDYMYVVGIKRFVNLKTWVELDKSQFADKFNLESTENVNKLLAGGFPQVDSLTFWPEMPLIVNDNGIKCLNTWKKPEIEPKNGDVKVFLEHMEYLFPDEYTRDILLDFLAFQVQNPGKKVLWSILIQGEEGIGKSYFAEVMKSCIGAHNVSCPTNENVHEPYTQWQKSASLIIIEELMARGRLELMNKLKPIITQTTTMIREMYKTAYEQPNRFNLLMFTNHEDAIILTKGDRRYCVMRSDVQMQEPEYYERLWAWTKKPESASKLLDFFQTRDLSEFKPNARAPMTEAKKRLIKISRTNLQEWVETCIEDECWPFAGDLVSIRHLKSRKVCPQGFDKISDYKWAEALRNAGASQFPQQIKLSDQSSTRMWAVRRQDTWMNEEAKVWRTQYEKWLAENDATENPLEDSAPI